MSYFLRSKIFIFSFIRKSTVEKYLSHAKLVLICFFSIQESYQGKYMKAVLNYTVHNPRISWQTLTSMQTIKIVTLYGMLLIYQEF
jgi:hypothetical protein